MRGHISFVIGLLLLLGCCDAYSWNPNEVLPNLADYQGRLDELNITLAADPQNLTVLEDLQTVYRMMKNTAYNLDDRPNFDKYFREESDVQDRIDTIRAARRIVDYQTSLGMTEESLKAKINASETQAYADPLNASAWQELSNVYEEMAYYHIYDDYSRYAYLKMDADDASSLAKYFKENGLDSAGNGNPAGNYTTFVDQYAKKTRLVKESEAERAQLYKTYEFALAAIANDTKRTSDAGASSAWATLAYDYISLSKAIIDLDNFNYSIDNTTIINSTAYYTCRKEALKCFDKAIKTAGSKPTSKYWLDSGRINNALGDWSDRDNATKCFDNGITAATKEHNNETLIGCLYLKAKNVREAELDQAAECYEAILKIDSYDPRIWKELSKVYKKLGRYNDASDADYYANLFKYESRSTMPNLPAISL